MKIFELVGVKKFFDKEIDDVLNSMSFSNYKEAGRGAFSIVMKHGSKSEVIKFWVADSAYDDFIDYVEKNPSVYFPKLLSKPKSLSAFFVRSKDFPDKIKYVRMEKLQKANDNQAYVVRHILKDIRDAETKKELDELIDEIVNDENKYLIKMVDDIGQFCEEMVKFVREVVIKKNNNIDIHSDNIMMRHGKLVITDPVYKSIDFKNMDKIQASLYRLKDIEEKDLIKGKISRKTE